MNVAAAMDGSAVMDGLLQGIQNEAGMRRSADAPTHDKTAENFDHERHIDKPSTGSDVGETGDPENVGRRGVEPPVDPVERARSALVTNRRAHRLASDHTLQPRSRWAGANLFVVLLIDPSSQELGSPAMPGRFSGSGPELTRRSVVLLEVTLMGHLSTFADHPTPRSLEGLRHLFSARAAPVPAWQITACHVPDEEMGYLRAA